MSQLKSGPLATKKPGEAQQKEQPSEPAKIPIVEAVDKASQIIRELAEIDRAKEAKMAKAAAGFVAIAGPPPNILFEESVASLADSHESGRVK